ncbi:MAG: hypothetical protein ABI024_03955 [Vicinamibacterales bacterium]
MTRTALAAAILALPREQQVCLNLFVVERCSPIEAAALMERLTGEHYTVEQVEAMYGATLAVLQTPIDEYLQLAAVLRELN